MTCTNCGGDVKAVRAYCDVCAALLEKNAPSLGNELILDEIKKLSIRMDHIDEFRKRLSIKANH